MAHSTDPRTARVIAFYEGLAPADLARLDQLYAPAARFKDPFNEVQGVDAVRRIFAHMFETVQSPRFIVREAVTEGDQAFLTWDFSFENRGRAMQIHGASQLRYGDDGRVQLHRDYWDAAEELYEKLPLLGALMRWLKRQAAVPSGG